MTLLISNHCFINGEKRKESLWPLLMPCYVTLNDKIIFVFLYILYIVNFIMN